METILITGGSGDLAQDFKNRFKKEFKILTPTRSDLDVTDEVSIKKFFLNNRIDVLINNAGVIHPKRLLDSDSALWINDINVNLVGTYLCSKNALEQNRKCIVINISSTAGYESYPDWSSYCISKSGVITFTKCLSNDGYRAFCLCPGAVDTKFRDNFTLNNTNVMGSSLVSEHIIDVIKGKYKPGDILFFRKDEFKINP
jgi:short-subunit dehydrogenase